MCLEIKEVKGKVCTKCGTFKEFSEFSPRKGRNDDGYYSYCRSCGNLDSSNYRNRQIFVLNKNSSLYKICSHCKQEKWIYNFSWKSKSKGLFHSECKECIKEKYYTGEIREKKLRQVKQYRRNNPDRIREQYSSVRTRVREKAYRERCKKELIEERLAKGAQPGDCILYVLKFWFKDSPEEHFFKIGTTKTSIKERYHSGYFEFDYKIVSEYYFEETYCKALEQKLLFEHRVLNLQYRFPEGVNFCGYTECFKELNEDIIKCLLS